MPKTYPLAIEEPLVDRDAFYSKGHHDPAEFIAALNAELEEDLAWVDSDPYPEWAAEAVDHHYWRNGQDSYSRSEEWGFTVYEYDEPGRGRYPVTVLWEDRFVNLCRKREASDA